MGKYNRLSFFSKVLKLCLMVEKKIITIQCGSAAAASHFIHVQLCATP